MKNEFKKSFKNLIKSHVSLYLIIQKKKKVSIPLEKNEIKNPSKIIIVSFLLFLKRSNNAPILLILNSDSQIINMLFQYNYKSIFVHLSYLKSSFYIILFKFLYLCPK